MNHAMAYGAEQRLDAQIADALFGQPGMSKMDVANRVRELRGDGPALLVQREAGQDERARFEAWAGDFYHLQRMGDTYRSAITTNAWQAWKAALSAQPSPGNGERLLREVCAQLESLDCGACIGSHAPMEDLHGRIAQHLAGQPSPGGQGDARELLAATFDRHGLPASAGMIRSADYVKSSAIVASVDAVECALAARQPVGQKPVAWMTHHDEPLLYPTFQEAAAYCDDDEPPIPLYAAPPAQAVDLGQLTDADVRAWVERNDLGGSFGSLTDARCAFDDARSAHLIDGKAVGK
ncbi:TPA: hypothetical protein ACKQAW_000403 [Stenotrophomonas maltophilia]